VTEVVVHYFAAAREAAGCASERLALDDGATLAHLQDEIARRHPAVLPLASTLRFAVDERFADDARAPLAADAVVAVIPPVSGG
jgi:molybdopterin converting factor subunit 1